MDYLWLNLRARPSSFPFAGVQYEIYLVPPVQYFERMLLILKSAINEISNNREFEHANIAKLLRARASEHLTKFASKSS